MGPQHRRLDALETELEARLSWFGHVNVQRRDRDREYIGRRMLMMEPEGLKKKRKDQTGPCGWGRGRCRGQGELEEEDDSLWRNKLAGKSINFDLCYLLMTFIYSTSSVLFSIYWSIYFTYLRDFIYIIFPKLHLIYIFSYLLLHFLACLSKHFELPLTAGWATSRRTEMHVHLFLSTYENWWSTNSARRFQRINGELTCN